ncbi:MAG: transketolase [Alphaproteobacteria bacterium]|nr:transketolase [Alphaproteobacteria bacterium]
MTQAAAVSENNTAPLSEAQMKKMANAIRFLTLDAIKAANSGHSGMPMGMADIATVLYSKFLQFDPKDPTWFNRDRVIFSNGHGSMLPYSLAYLTGFDKITLDEIKNFRQLGSHTPGHPEVDFDAGIETTTGPLGQGISNSVGFALAERILNARFSDDLVNHYTYVFTGDGCLMEGISHEACSLAGHLKLNKLIVFYDDNNVTIDGTIDLTFSDNTRQRFEAYGWNTDEIDGHNPAEIEAAIIKAQKSDKPTLIACKTKIGFGCPTQESQPSAHGAITNDDEIAGARKNLDWAHEPFEIPEDILNDWRAIGAKGRDASHAWKNTVNSADKKDELLAAIALDMAPKIKPIIQKVKEQFAADKPKDATRKCSGTVLSSLIPEVKEMVGGSADLTGSNNTKVGDSKVVDAADYGGNYINYGVREHGMAAAMNGLALHGGIIPYAGTFLQFADYSRPAIRLAALMEQRVIHVMTHDSIGLGEDGPTHQPVEHVAAIRAIPNCYLYRPCDGIETAESWELALNRKDGPSVLALTRQGIPTVCDNRDDNKVAKGAYILKDSDGEPEVTIFASGSEVHLALEAAEQLGANVRVVSVPCMELFFEQDEAYISSVIPSSGKSIAIEAAVRQGWDRLIGRDGIFIGMDSFGASAPAGELFKHFGITTEAIIEAAK